MKLITLLLLLNMLMLEADKNLATVRATEILASEVLIFSLHLSHELTKERSTILSSNKFLDNISYIPKSL